MNYKKNYLNAMQPQRMRQTRIAEIKPARPAISETQEYISFNPNSTIINCNCIENVSVDIITDNILPI